MLGSTFIEPLRIECRQTNGILRGTKLRSKPYIRRKRSTLPARNSMIHLGVEHVHNTTTHSLTSKCNSNLAAITPKKLSTTDRQFMLQLTHQLASITQINKEAPVTRIKAIWSKKTTHETVNHTNPQAPRNKETKKLRNCLVVIKPSRPLHPLAEFYAAKKRKVIGSEAKKVNVCVPTVSVFRDK